MEKNVTSHIGKNIQKLRILKGFKQETLAKELGMSQSEFSFIENSEIIDDVVIIKIAEILNLTPEIIKEFNENHAFYSIDNKLENVTIHENGQGIHQVFSPIDKVVELYERLLASEREKLEMLKQLTKK
ncbi:helix-turn-helix domain-containing protein [Gelidibacter gilvus]|uniref:XRE family transcriptional regulator n=1 Tax=Gelidibacter gilvus TaxID=59602 RepID=A0A4Q0XDG9_9FLAO|nr:helix-turn-helix transcriptional regulator [Gelidibacter gilvus]RXJ45390.1 XRE family transcriptional regulator [Gelidibacter gilvus]